ncbi:MAG: HAD family acid phosphatase [bacterium]
MKLVKTLLVSLVFVLANFVFAKIQSIPEPPNLGILKQSIRSYIESGSYERDIENQINQAIEYLYERVRMKKAEENLAVVFDIDETLLSNLEYEYLYDFGYNKETWLEWVRQSKAKSIKPSLKLYNLCQKLNISIFIITGRNQLTEELKEDPTVINLKKEGYHSWKKIFFKPINSKMSTTEYKTSCRKEIESQGYKIILNVGDQWSDLVGGYSEKIIKLPNPMYYIP